MRSHLFFSGQRILGFKDSWVQGVKGKNQKQKHNTRILEPYNPHLLVNVLINRIILRFIYFISNRTGFSSTQPSQPSIKKGDV
jgi:hypothetical protein